MTSWALHEMTGGRAWLRDVEVVLPHTWGRAACTPGGISVGETSTSNAEFVVSSGGQLPVALQSGGCGEQGEHLHLPLTFLTSNTTHQADLLAREFARFRYGVFPETGFPDDPLYPAVYHEGEATVESSGCPGQLFCPLGAISPLAPTKQNLLCGATAIETIMAGREGRRVYSGEERRDPTFTYIEAAPPSFVLVLDQSRQMGRRRWSSVKKALYRFIGLLPEGSSLAVVVYGETATVVLPPTTVTEEKREGLHGRVPRRVLEQTLASPCLECGLRLASEMVRKDGGNIVLMTRGDGDTSEEFLEATIPSNIRLFTLAFPSFESGAGPMPLGSLSTYYRVEEATDALSSLTDCLLDVLNRVTPGLEGVQKLFESHHVQHEFSGSFFVEEDLRTDIVVTLSIDDEQKIEFFEVSDPSGRKNIFSKFEDGLVLFRFPGDSEPGVWSFRAKLYSDSALPVREMVVDVVARGQGKDEAVMVSGKSLTRDGVPVVVARVTKGNLPVHGAEVVAKVSGPGGSLDIVLQDSGLGYPDVTSGDGLYSGYLPTFSPVAGPLSVTIRATEGGRSFTSPSHDEEEEDCCGSSRPHSRRDPTGKFSRYLASPAVFTLLVSPNGTDLSPPSRIPDLKLVATNHSSVTIGLTWTAPGGDFDQGQARGYLVGCHTDPTYLNETNFASKAILVHAAESLSAQAYGFMEQMSAGVPWAGQTFYYGVVAVDAAGNRGPVSNLVAAFIMEPTTTTTTTTVSPSLRRGDSGAMVHTRDQVVLGAVLAGSLLVLLSLLVLCVVVRRKRAAAGKSRPVEEDTYRAGYLPDTRHSKAREAEGCDGVYSWLETLPRSEGEGSSGGSGGSPAATEGDSVSDTQPEESGPEEAAAHLVHGYENFDAQSAAGAAPMPARYASEIFNRSKQYFSVRGVSGSIVEAVADDTASVRLGSSYMSMKPPDHLLPPHLPSPHLLAPHLPSPTPIPPLHPFHTSQRRTRHESVV